jgi:hypothetical protein
MRLKHMVTTTLGLLCLASRVLAWDAVGHTQIADIAWSKLTPHAKSEITAILMQGDPRYRPVSEKESDVRDAFRRASVYADVIKGDRTTQYEEIIPKMNLLFFTTAKPDPKNREDELCKTWHYYDTPIRDKAGNHPAPESNALKAMTMARAEMTKLEAAPVKDRKMQCWWLYWMEHVVGDLHQPLHCVSSYEFQADGDAGGNKIQVLTDPAQPDRRNRLHGYWDGGIARAIGADKQNSLSPNIEDVTKRWSEDPTLKPSDKDAANLNVSAWIATGAKQADAIVYKDLKQDAPLPTGYADTQILLCKHEAVLAGTRLANLLNSLLGK